MNVRGDFLGNTFDNFVKSRLTTLIFSLIARQRVGPQLYDGSDLKTYLLMKGSESDAQFLVRPTGV